MAREYARKRLRRPELIDEDKEMLLIRRDEILKVVGHTKYYNHAGIVGTLSDVETPYEFVLNRLDDLNYSLSKQEEIHD